MTELCICPDNVNDIISYLDGHEYLMARLVFRDIKGDPISFIYDKHKVEPFNLNDTEYAIFLAKKNLFKRLKCYKNIRSVAIYNAKWANRLARPFTRWPEAEKIIIKNARQATLYAIFNIRGRWHEAEKYIIKDAYFAYKYVTNAIKCPLPIAEPTILKNISITYRYMKEFKKYDWKEALELFATNSKYAYKYAKKTNSRFIAGEAAILADDDISIYYKIYGMRDNDFSKLPSLKEITTIDYHVRCIREN
jgi:hypothetical protein